MENTSIVTKTEFDRLVKVSKLKTLENNTYIVDKENANFIWIKKNIFGNLPYDLSEKDRDVETLLNEKTKLFNSWSGLFTAVARTFSFYVGNPEVDICIELSPFVTDYITCWYAVIGLERTDSELNIKYLPAENYSNDNNEHRILRVYQHDIWNGTLKYYLLEQKYLIWSIENKLYEAPTVNAIWMWQLVNVPLNTIPQTEFLKDIEVTELEVPAIFIVKDENYEELILIVSLLEKIKNIVYSIDRKLVVADMQYLNNVENFIIMKNITIPQKLIEKYNNWNKINFNELWKVVMGREDSDIQFVSNKNELIVSAWDSIDKQIRAVSAITNVPVDFLWMDTAHGSIGEGSRSLLHGAFIKNIESIRELFTETLEEIMEIMVLEDPELDTAITWWDVYAKDSMDLVNELKVAREISIISKETAMKKYLAIDWIELEEEMARIEEENTQQETLDQLTLEIEQTKSEQVKAWKEDIGNPENTTINQKE